VAIISQPYLENIPREDALRCYLDRLEGLGALNTGEAERIPVEQCRGRITAQPVFAAVSSPHYHAAAMDGIAVNSADTFGASETTPLRINRYSSPFFHKSSQHTTVGIDHIPGF
jgi:putative molybdopterin biosynthesis protein